MTAEEILRRALWLLDVELPATATNSTTTARDLIAGGLLDLGISARPASVTNSTLTARQVLDAAFYEIGLTGKPASPTNSAETARTVITNALRQAGILSAGETPSDDDAMDALAHLQHMLDEWANRGVTLDLGTLALATAIAKPVQYIEAIQANLAARLSEAFGHPPDAPLAQRATDLFSAMRAVERSEAGLGILQSTLDSWLNDGISLGLGVLTLNTVIAIPVQHMDALKTSVAVALAHAAGAQVPPALAERAQRDYGLVRGVERSAQALPVLQDMLNAWQMEGASYALGVLTFSTVLAVPVDHIEAIRAGFAARYASRIGAQVPPAVQGVAQRGEARVKAYYRAVEGYGALNDMLAEWETQGVRLGALADADLLPTSEVAVPSTHRNAIIYGLAVRVAPTIPVEAPQSVAALAARAYAALRAQYTIVPILRIDPALGGGGYS